MIVFGGTDPETRFSLEKCAFTAGFSKRACLNAWEKVGTAPLTRKCLLDPKVSQTLGDEDGIQGFNNPLISGIRKATITLQTQTYVPGSWHGFRFSPFYNMTLGMLGNETDKFLNNSLLSKFSIGVLINNDYLVFNSFQISLSFYPKIPFEGTNVFNTNSYKNNDLSLPDYEIGQPSIVLYK